MVKMRNKNSSKTKKDEAAPPPKVKLISAESLLLRLYQKNQISEPELKAGLRYIHDFMVSGMQGHYAKIHYDIVGIDAMPAAHANDNFSPTELQMVARHRLKSADKKLGLLAASCFYHVLGLGMSLRDFSHKICQAGYQGQKRYLSAHQAMGVLLSGLACIADR